MTIRAAPEMFATARRLRSVVVMILPVALIAALDRTDLLAFAATIAAPDMIAMLFCCLDTVPITLARQVMLTDDFRFELAVELICAAPDMTAPAALVRNAPAETVAAPVAAAPAKR